LGAFSLWGVAGHQDQLLSVIAVTARSTALGQFVAPSRAVNVSTQSVVYA